MKTSPNPARTRTWPRLAAGIACAMLIALTALTPAIAAKDKKGPSKADLKKAERALADAQAEAKILGNQIAHSEARQVELRGEVEGLKAEVAIAESEYEKATALLEETESKKDEVEGNIQDLQEIMDLRASTSYMNGPAGGLSLLLDSTSLSDLTARNTFLNALQIEDQNHAQNLQVYNHDLQEIKHVQFTEKKQAEKILKYLKSQQSQLSDKIGELNTLMADLNKQYHQKHALEKKWGDRVDVIAEKLNTVVVGGNGPLYACPVPEYTWWSNDFGAPRVGHTHQGNDIGGKEGADIVAPFDGRAETSSDSLGGLTVKVYGKDGYVYNAHLSRYGATGNVDAGEVVGYVGDSGNAAGTSPHDHFEWHPGGGDAVDPYPYLSEVCK